MILKFEYVLIVGVPKLSKMKKLSYAEIVEILDFFHFNIWYELLPSIFISEIAIWNTEADMCFE